MIEKRTNHNVDGFGRGPKCRKGFRGIKPMRLAFVVEDGSNEGQTSREVDPPVAVEVVMSRQVPHG